MKDALNDAYPTAPVPGTLAARVEARLSTQRPQPRRTATRLILATAALAALALLVPRWLTPRRTFALDRVDSALKRVKRIHIATYSGSWHASEEWFEGTSKRYDHCDSDRDSCHVYYIVTGGKRYEVVGDTNKTVAVSTLVDEPTPSPIHSLTEILHTQELADLGERTHFEGRKIIDGRQTDVVKIDLPSTGYELGNALPKPRYQRLFIDSATDLPFRIEEWVLEGPGTGWTGVRQEIQFDQPLPPGTFSTAFPGMPQKSMDVVASEGFHTRVHQPGKHTPIGQNGITIRQFSVMEALGLVVWYTLDEESTPPTLALSGKGNRCPLLAQGIMGDNNPALRERYTIDGKRLRWAYFQQTFVAPMGNGDWQLQVSFPDAQATVRPEVSGFGNTLPSGEAGNEIGLTAPTLAGERARDRAEYFLDGRWKEDGPLLGAAQQGQLIPREQALFWLREAVRQDNHWLKNPKHARDWRRQAEVLDQLKRYKEAEQLRAQASAER